MTEDALGARRKTYDRVSSDIAAMSDIELRALLVEGEASPGWGKHQIVEIGEVQVFVKSIPVTDLEHEHAFSTRNLYDLPLYYNYGVGSAGFGAFRELLTHIKTTEWVLEGASTSFPLLYQYRLMPFSGERAVLDEERRNGYVRYWAGSESIARYLDERMRANYELVLFLEYVPHTLHAWLVEHPADCVALLDHLRDAISFLRAQGVIHFDAHYRNVLTDGEQVYASDFGLALDRGFDLTAEERRFLAEHEYYDYGEISWSLGSVLIDMVQKLPAEGRQTVMARAGMTGNISQDESIGPLVRGVEQLAGIMSLEPVFVETVGRLRDVIVLMNEFYASMHRNVAKDTQLDLVRLRQLLVDSRFVD